MLLSRDDDDATHTLFVLDHPAPPTRYLFVRERSGEVVNFDVSADGPGVVIRRQADKALIRLSTPRAARLDGYVRREADGLLSHVQVSEDGGRAEFDLVDEIWRAVYSPEGHVTIEREGGPERAVVQAHPESLSRMSACYDVWVQGKDSDTVSALRMVVEALIVRRLSRFQDTDGEARVPA